MRPGYVAKLRRETVDMFYHGFDNYMTIAFPEDELRPVSCAPLTRDAKNPRNFELNDALGNYSLTLIDSLSTLAILASAPPDEAQMASRALGDFQDGVVALVELYGDGRSGPSGQGLRSRGFDVDSKVQVFETVIRGVGGLLSAHLFAVGELPIHGYQSPPRIDESDDDKDVPLYDDVFWPNGFRYDGQLLRLALDLGQRLLPAFYTKTGMPYPRVNLRYGIPFYTGSPLHNISREVVLSPGPSPDGAPEITETCSAGAGSLVLEFTVLSRLTGDPRFEQAAKRAFWAVWARKSHIGLIGAGVDAEKGQWIGSYSVIGAGADSFFEYAFKSHILLSGQELPNRTSPLSRKNRDPGWLDPNELFPPLSDEQNSAESFLEAWHHAHAAIKRHLYSDLDHPHYMNVNLWTGSLVSYWVDSLGAYYAGLLALAGEVNEAIETHLLYAAIWSRFAALPERYSLRDKTVESGLGWWPLRPEFIETTYHLYRATKDPWYLYIGEMVLHDITQRCRTPCGWAGLQNVVDGEKSDRMESFFLGETAKYMYLLFDDQHPLNSLDSSYVFSTEGHPLVIPRKRRRHQPPSTTTTHEPVVTLPSKARADWDDDHYGFTTSCPAIAKPSVLGGSAIATRLDLYHAPRLLELHDTSRLPSSKSGAFPWTLPDQMLPDNGTCAEVSQPVEMLLEFGAESRMSSGKFGVHDNSNLERLSASRIRVHSMAGLKLTLRLEEEDGEAPQWRVTKVNWMPLGRDENIVIRRAILGNVDDMRFVVVRDPVVVKLQHLHNVVLQHDVDSGVEAVGDEDDIELARRARTSISMKIQALIKNLVRRMADVTPTAALDATDLAAAAAAAFETTNYTLSSNLLINQSALTSAGLGSGPLPGVDVPAHAHLPRSGPVPRTIVPWTTIYGAGTACSGVLPDSVPRQHQVLVLRRGGGCSFAEKLRVVPAYPPSPTSLQIVVVVSDDAPAAPPGLGYYSGEWQFMTRPLLEEVQHTPGGIVRRYPIPLVLVGGGEEAYQQLVAAEGVGITRRYWVESQGLRVRNLIVDDGDAGWVS